LQSVSTCREQIALLISPQWSCALVLALMATCISDLLYRRISNNLMLTVLAMGMSYWGCRYGWAGIAFASAGAATGLFALLGLYIIGWLGAGDVKIFAAFGALLGAKGILSAGIFGVIAGGLLSIAYIDRRGLRWDLLSSGRALERARITGQTVPLGAALAMGVLLVEVGFTL
jgi:prepilin peptidase CpaA